MSAELEALKQKRLNWVEANRDNDFDEGINRLLTELYPDNAHFIYELLQNAEDPQATEVQFILTNSSVKFTHNGERLFTFKDVKSITSIGNSTKRDDATSIGKFGVGFKAVFAYTNTPEIHSGDFHFRIRDLVVPDIEGVTRTTSEINQTCFLFPFDNPKKPAVTAMKDIKKGLQALGDNSLLFLSHIRKIDYTLPDGSKGSLERIPYESGRIEIHTNKPYSEKEISHWLHFHKDVEVNDENGNTKICRIAIAYQLEQTTDKNKEKTGWKIVSVEHGGQVSIYFPAEKETSKLRFHIHAPFASTVARDSVRDCNDNEQLRDHLAELIVESLTMIRDQGMLTMSFLAVLPNLKDELAEFYEPIRTKIVDAFKSQALTPTRSGSHAKAGALYRGPAKIPGVIDDEDLSLLTNYKIPLWAANASQTNQRDDNFLDNLDIDKWDFEQLTAIFQPANKEKIESWLAEKEDDWLMRFYALLGEACLVHSKCAHVSNLRIIRVSMDDGDKHVIPKEAYFSIEDNEISQPPDVLFVKPAVYAGGRSESQKKFVKYFLEKGGVRPYDLKASIQLRLEHYKNPPKQVDANYYKDMTLFIAYCKKNPLEQVLFRNSAILLGVSDGDNLYWLKPEELCLDEPYLETGLAKLVTIHKKMTVWQSYQEKLSKSQLKDFVDFLKVTGVMVTLRVEKAKLNGFHPYFDELMKDRTGRESSYEIDEDYTIPNLIMYLKLKSISCSLLIWNALINAESIVAKASYRPNSKYLTQTADSQLVCHLKSYAWIPNKQGSFCKPQDMSRDELPDDFPFNNTNGLLTAIEFGKTAKDKEEKEKRLQEQATASFKEKEKNAQELGFDSASEAEEAARLTEELGGIANLREIAARRNKSTEQPEESVPNPERRRKNVLERSENAPSKESVMRERSIQQGIATVTAEAKAYLRVKYTNANHELVCQCCQQEMPFKIGDAYYFEAVQCLKKVDKHHIENHLALCPICAAMYKHARIIEDSELRSLLIEHNTQENATSAEIPLMLAGKEYFLRFVGTHFFDLQTVLGEE